MNPRYRPIAAVAGGLVLVWALVLGGMAWSRSIRPTAEGVARYLRETRFETLSGEARARAWRELAERLNRLPPEERRKARLAGLWRPWFEAMTDEERLGFIDATAPSGFRQMLASFETMDSGRRQRAIDEAMKRLREARESAEGAEGGETGDTNGPPLELSSESRERAARIGLKAFYAESSARTKAELAPLLEELQQAMATGRLRGAGPLRRFDREERRP